MAQFRFNISGKNLTLSQHKSQIANYFKSKPADDYLLRYLKRYCTPTYTKRGKLLANDNTYRFNGYPDSHLAENLTWSENPFKSRNWQFSFHKLLVLRYLIAAHSQTSQDRYIVRTKSVIRDWLHDNYVNDFPSTLSWHDHGTAHRLLNLLLFFEYIRLDTNDVDFIATLLGAIYSHCLVLLDQAFYSPLTNHGFDQSYILYWVASALPEMIDSPQMRQIASSRVRKETAFMFTADGVHVENSPGYHLRMLHLVQFVDRLYTNYSKSLANSATRSVLDSAYRYLAFAIKPNGHLPLVGDTLDRKVSLPEKGPQYPHYAHFLYSASAGKQGSKPAHADIVLPYSGYAIFRNKWHSHTDFINTVYLFFTTGFLSRYHRHDDDLSFVLYAFGEDWVIDSGLYKYLEDDPLRIYMRSNRAHNTVVINGVDVARDISQASNRSKITGYSTGIQHSYVTGSTGMYPGYSVKRRIDFHKPARIIISDTISREPSQPQEAPHRETYKILFHIPHDKEVSIEGNRVLVLSASGTKMVLSTKGTNFSNIYIVSGQKEPEYQGWVSYKHRKAEQSKCVIFEKEASSLHSCIEIQLVQ